MEITKEILESTVKDIAKIVLPAIVDEDYNIEEKEPYELYNAIVGTVFDEEGYETVVEEAPEYLYAHIPGGNKMINLEKKSFDLTGDDKVDASDVAYIGELLNSENITYDQIKKGDISGDMKLTEEDKKLVESEAKRQSTIEVEEDENEGGNE